MKQKITLLFLACLSLHAFAQWKPTNGLFAGEVHSVIKSNNEIIVGTKYIYKSSDNGKTWFISNNGITGTVTAIRGLANSGTNLVAATDAGIFYSNDNGNNWTPSSGTASLNIWCLTRKGSDTLFISTAANGIYKSVNHGQTWNPCNTGITNITDMRAIVAKGHDLYAATDGYGIYRSTNQGANWTQTTSGLPGSFYGISSLVVANNIVFAGTEGAGVYISTTGTSWSAINNGISNTDYIMGMGVNGNTVYASTFTGSLLQTTNSQDWTAVPIPTYTVSRFESFYSAGPSEFYVGCWGAQSGEKSYGVFRTRDDGATWQQIGITDYPVSVLEVSGANILAGTNDITGNSTRTSFFKTTEADSTWTFNLGGLNTGNVTALKGNGSGVMYLFDDEGPGNSLLYRSTNNGLNWTSTGFNALYDDFVTIAFAGTTIYLGDVSGYSTVVNSTNNGGVFNDWSTGLPTSVHYVYSLVIKGILLFAGTDNGVYKSTVGTNSWTATANTLSGKTVNSLFVSGTTIFAGIQSDGIYKTSNDGTTWTSASTGLPLFSSGTCFAASGANIFAGTDYGVYSTINGGGLWSPINTGLLDSTITTMVTSANYLWVGTNSQGVWRRQLSQLYTSTGEIAPEPTFTISPNPATTFINIQIPKDINKHDNLIQIFNTMGSLVWQKSTGDASITIEISDLPKGMYFVRVQNNGNIQTEKIVIQ